MEYAHRHLDEYVYTFWATAHSREALVSAYLTIASLLKLPECDAKDRALAVDAVKRWLSSQEGWLLILDNANDLGTAREFIPQGKNGHVILTTRARAVGAVARVVKIKTMDTEEGGLFLLRRAKYVAENAALDFAAMADQANAIEIATQLHGLPLALDQAGAYTKRPVAVSRATWNCTDNALRNSSDTWGTGVRKSSGQYLDTLVREH